MLFNCTNIHKILIPRAVAIKERITWIGVAGIALSLVGVFILIYNCVSIRSGQITYKMRIRTILLRSLAAALVILAATACRTIKPQGE